ncbi:MAG: rhodanese-like domain-containing protein [Spirochaeta sp.]|jgi:rhodanese-related sulfurtransferase|nr:rhodanese-like domain-containing protein [Spirochaeta sp.]
MNVKAIVSIVLLFALLVSCGNQEAEQAATPQPAQTSAAAPAEAESVSVRDTVDAYFANMPDHIYKIAQAEFLQMVGANSDMTVIDIRRADDYAEGHITGAVNMPWGTPAMYEMLSYIPAAKPVFVNCYSGQTAGQAVALLNMAGIPARSINLGWNFGLSRVEGMEQYVETTANSLPSTVQTEIPTNIMEAYQAYYEATAAAAGTPFASNIVSEENAKAILDAGDEDVLFVSIRKPEHYAEAHIEGAINIPFGVGMQENFASLPADKKLIVYCYTGQTAGQTVAALRMLGYDAVSLRGGMGMPANEPLGWMSNGYPTVSSN